MCPSLSFFAEASDIVLCELPLAAIAPEPAPPANFGIASHNCAGLSSDSPHLHQQKNAKDQAGLLFIQYTQNNNLFLYKITLDKKIKSGKIKSAKKNITPFKAETVFL